MSILGSVRDMEDTQKVSLTEFLKARLDEDEAYGPRPLEPGEYPNVFESHEPGAPARVLREVTAKRAILDRHAPHETAFSGLACDWCSEDVDDRPQIAKERWPCPDVLSLAAVYSDHPDYDPGWKP
jgi:hypothetical protein